MTHRDYEIVAAGIKAAVAAYPKDRVRLSAIWTTVVFLMDRFAAQNPRFKRAQFANACGFTATGFLLAA